MKKLEQQQLYLPSDLRELLKEEAKATTNGNISLLAQELIREGLKVKVKERIRKEDEMKNLIDKVTNARQIYDGYE
tara:strand:+ start:411 stop:638 length:228 start_codon:yes stop_codon:yes gene_type:complete